MVVKSVDKVSWVEASREELLVHRCSRFLSRLEMSLGSRKNGSRLVVEGETRKTLVGEVL